MFIHHKIGKIPVIASLGAGIAFLCVIVGTLGALQLLIITHKHYKKGIIMNMFTI
jgi:hypothetical protein